MPTLLAATNLIESFLRAGIVGQVITLSLAVFSIIAWTIMWGKNHELKRLRLLNLTFVDARAREVVVYDNTGKRVHQSVVYGAHERIDLSFLAVGSYHLHVSQGEERLHRIIVVTR
jgi:biopolymer transport protein TolQ